MDKPDYEVKSDSFATPYNLAFYNWEEHSQMTV